MNQNTNQSAVIEEISPEEAAGVMGGRGRRQRIRRIVEKKRAVRLIRLKRGSYTKRYKATITRNKQTVSQTSFRPAGNWSFS